MEIRADGNVFARVVILGYPRHNQALLGACDCDVEHLFLLFFLRRSLGERRREKPFAHPCQNDGGKLTALGLVDGNYGDFLQLF